MTNHNDSGPESAESVIARARNAEPPVMALPEQQPDDCEQDTWMEAAFTALPASDLFDPAVLAAVELMMNDCESVTVSARQRLVEGAGRAVRWRRRLDNRLGNLLREHRRARQLTPGDIAASPTRDRRSADRRNRNRSQAGPLADCGTGSRMDTVRQPGVRRRARRPSGPLASGQAPEQVDSYQPAGGFTCDVAAALGRSSGRC